MFQFCNLVIDGQWIWHVICKYIILYGVILAALCGSRPGYDIKTVQHKQ